MSHSKFTIPLTKEEETYLKENPGIIIWWPTSKGLKFLGTIPKDAKEYYESL